MTVVKSNSKTKDLKKTILFFGGYDPEYPRNRILRNGLRKTGFDVSECRADIKSKIITRYPLLTKRFLGDNNKKNDLIFVPDFRHKDVPLAWLLSRITGKKLIFDPLVSRYMTRVLDREDAREGSLTSCHNRNIDRVSMKLADLVLSDTEAHGDFYSEEFGIDRKKIRTLYIGFDDEHFHINDDRPGSERFKILFYGSYLPLHGVDTIVKAAKLLADSPVSITMVGKGQTYSIARELARDIPCETISFRENVKSNQLCSLIGEHDLVLGIFGKTPKANIVIPNKIFQGSASGRPVITADTPAIREIFTAGRDIILVPAGNSEKLAGSIEMVRKDKDLRRTITSNGTDRVRSTFNPMKTAEKLLSILSETGISV